MRRLLAAILFVLVLGTVVTLGESRKISGLAPRDIVEEVVWTMGVSGELLTPEGWNRASGYFVEPSPVPQDKSFDVISNNYGFYSISIDNDKAEVAMEFTDAGRIDSTLRYSPPRPTRAYKTDRLFRLVLTPGYIRNFGPDGKTGVREDADGRLDMANRGSSKAVDRSEHCYSVRAGNAQQDHGPGHQEER